MSLAKRNPLRTLYFKVFSVAFLNLLALAILFFGFVQVQFRLDLDSFLLSPSHDRILAAGRQLALNLREVPRSGWDDLLARYETANKVEMHLLDRDGAFLAGSKKTIPADVLARLSDDDDPRPRRRREHEGHEGSLLFLGRSSSPAREWAGIRIPIPDAGGSGFTEGVLLAGSSGESTLFFFDPKPWLAAGTAVLIVSVLCWLPLVRGLTTSVSRLNRATAQMADGQFEVQLPTVRRDELGTLSASINRMASRLAGFVKGQKRFLGDTAHELCSPIARMQVATAILERSATPEQQSTVEALKEDVEHLSGLVGELLSFSKAGMRPAEVKLTPVDVAGAVKRAVGRESSGAARIEVSVDPAVRAMADSDLLTRAVSNVLRNAIRYAAQAGPIAISAAVEGKQVVIRIADSGPGLPASELDAVFEPFYRTAPARERETGGVGLGLSIVKTCVSACQGSVLCANRTPSGLEVQIRLQKA